MDNLILELRQWTANRFTQLANRDVTILPNPNDFDGNSLQSQVYGKPLAPEKMSFVCKTADDMNIQLHSIVSINQSSADLEWSIEATLPFMQFQIDNALNSKLEKRETAGT